MKISAWLVFISLLIIQASPTVTLANNSHFSSDIHIQSDETRSLAETTRNGVNMRSEPTTNAGNNIVSTLSLSDDLVIISSEMGDEVSIGNETSDIWYQVENICTGELGYVSSLLIEEVESTTLEGMQLYRDTCLDLIFHEELTADQQQILIESLDISLNILEELNVDGFGRQTIVIVNTVDQAIEVYNERNIPTRVLPLICTLNRGSFAVIIWDSCVSPNPVFTFSQNLVNLHIYETRDYLQGIRGLFVPSNSPAWVDNGLAIYIMWDYFGGPELKVFEEVQSSELIFDQESFIENLEAQEHAMFAVAVLYQQYGGIDAFWDFYRLADTNTWQNAFEQAFGISVFDFYNVMEDPPQIVAQPANLVQIAPSETVSREDLRGTDRSENPLQDNLIDYLISEYGLESYNEFIDLYQQSRDIDDSLVQVYGFDEAELRETFSSTTFTLTEDFEGQGSVSDIESDVIELTEFPEQIVANVPLNRLQLYENPGDVIPANICIADGELNVLQAAETQRGAITTTWYQIDCTGIYWVDAEDVRIPE